MFNRPANAGAAKASDRPTANAHAIKKATGVATHRFEKLDIVIPWFRDAALPRQVM
jgi:hypothetical protein